MRCEQHWSSHDSTPRSRGVPQPVGRAPWIVGAGPGAGAGIQSVLGSAPAHARPRAKGDSTLSRMLYLVGAVVGGAVGWWAGERAGVMVAFFLSLVGTAAGIYFGRRIGKRYFF